jgi:hypothetical protein
MCYPQQSYDLPDFESGAKFYYDRFDAAIEEDRKALENQQRGFNSPFTKPGRYSVGMELNVSALPIGMRNDFSNHRLGQANSSL